MGAFEKSMRKLKTMLEDGYLQEAYRGLMEYIRGLRAHFKKKYPQFSVPTNIYYGYMDMTYFAILTPLTRQGDACRARS